MTCDECAVYRAEAEDARASVRHLEQLVQERPARASEATAMNRLLHAEVSRLQAQVAELTAELLWRNADG